MRLRVQNRVSLVAYLVILMVIQGLYLDAQVVQWRGPQRDGKYTGNGLLKEWPAGGPELILKKENLGKGYSTPVLYNGEIFITGKRDTMDVVTKLDMQGNILWETAYGESWNQTYSETRNTPTIENGKLYIMAGMGNVACLDTESGEILWSRNTHAEFKAEFHKWGAVESLLLTEKAVISSPMSKEAFVVALDKNDGSLLWKSKGIKGKRSYVSPLLINHNGKEIVILLSHKYLVGADPTNGKIFFKYDVATGYGKNDSRINIITPLYYDGNLFVNSGYDSKAIMFTLSEDAASVEPEWVDSTLDTHLGGVVLVDGYIYGSNWINNGKGNWACLDWETGKVMYEETWNNKGSIIYSDGLLYVYEEKRGNVGLVEPTPEGFKVVSSFRVEGGTGPYWAHMSIYDGKLLIRHGEVLFVYNIAS